MERPDDLTQPEPLGSDLGVGVEVERNVELDLSPLTAPPPPEAPPDMRVFVVRSEERMPPWVRRAIVYAFIGVVLLYLGRGVVTSLRGFIITILVSLFLSFAMEPAVNWLNARGWRRGSATGLIFLAMVVSGGLFLYVMVDLVVNQVTDLVENAPEYTEEAVTWINDTFDADIQTDELDETFEEYQGDIDEFARQFGSRAFTLTGKAVGVIFQLFTIGLFTFYLVADGPRLRRAVLGRMREDRQRVVLQVWELAIQKTGGYIYSRVVLAFFSAFAASIAFLIIGVPSPVAMAIWVGLVSQFIPVIGTYLAGAFPLIIAAIDEPVSAVWVIGFILLYQQIENYLISPRVTAHTMQIHPAVAFASVIIGGSLLGAVGGLLALPAAAIIQAFLSTYFQRFTVVTSELTQLQAQPLTSEQIELSRGLSRVANLLVTRRRATERLVEKVAEEAAAEEAAAAERAEDSPSGEPPSPDD